jgi:chromosome segregation ATPase
MCKKLVLAAVAILVGTAVVKHTSIGSLAQVWWRDAKQAVERQVPPEVQIKQLGVEVGKIDADIKRNLSKLAQQEVETQKLDDDVASLKESQATLKAEIAAMTKGLENNTEKVSINGRNIRFTSLTRQLDNSVAKYERNKAEVKSKEKLLASKREALEAAHARIAEMSTQKELLRDTVANLETRLQLARLNATRNHSTVEFDDSQVARCNQLANEISERLAVGEKEMELNAKYGYGVAQPKPEESKPTAEVLKAAKKALQDDAEERVAAGDK